MEKTQDEEAFEAVCAIDILKEIANSDGTFIDQFAESKLGLTDAVLETIMVDIELACFHSDDPMPSIRSLGDYFRCLRDYPELPE